VSQNPAITCTVPPPPIGIPLRVTSWYENTSLKVCMIFSFAHWTPTLINKPPTAMDLKLRSGCWGRGLSKFCYIQMKEQYNAQSAESFHIMNAEIGDGNTNPGAPVWTRTEWKYMEQAHTRVTMWTACTPYPAKSWIERAGEERSKEGHIFSRNSFKEVLHYYKIRKKLIFFYFNIYFLHLLCSLLFCLFRG
jgi:hypothetical protein